MTIAGAVEEQTATTNEIVRNVAEAARASMEISESMNGVAAAADGTTQGAGHSQHASYQLAEMALELRTLVERFIVDESEESFNSLEPDDPGENVGAISSRTSTHRGHESSRRAPYRRNLERNGSARSNRYGPLTQEMH